MQDAPLSSVVKICAELGVDRLLQPLPRSTVDVIQTQDRVVCILLCFMCSFGLHPATAVRGPSVQAMHIPAMSSQGTLT